MSDQNQPVYSRISQCGSKKRYFDQKTAESSIADINSKKKPYNRKKPLVCYHCYHCGYWHIGHKVTHVQAAKDARRAAA